jgi:hypothetical protein
MAGGHGGWEWGVCEILSQWEKAGKVVLPFIPATTRNVNRRIIVQASPGTGSKK